MYGKMYESTFTGSMVGTGPTMFAVWGYVIANTKPPGIVELNPTLLATVIGCSIEDITTTINRLCAPDLESRGKEFNGARLIKVGAFLYDVPRWAYYRGLRNDDERRAYNRDAQRRHREKMSKEMSMTVIERSALSAQAEAEAKAEALKPITPLPPLLSTGSIEDRKKLLAEQVKTLAKQKP